jgi:Ca-activated chloride channel family protein
MQLKCKRWFAFVIAVFLCLPVFSQQEKAATISGTIKDARTKSPINEAVITLSSTAFTGQKFALTDSTGSYRINNLPPGSYSITFEMEGYHKFVRENIALQEGMSVGVDFEMIRERNRIRKGS